jgi:hypothetical protein
VADLDLDTGPSLVSRWQPFAEESISPPEPAVSNASGRPCPVIPPSQESQGLDEERVPAYIRAQDTEDARHEQMKLHCRKQPRAAHGLRAPLRRCPINRQPCWELLNSSHGKGLGYFG